MMKQHDPWIDHTLGDNNRYRLLKLLGQGGAGKVYKAYDQRDSNYCAIKFLSAELLNNIDAKLRFQREAQTCLLLQNPHIVRTLDFGIISMPVSGYYQDFPMLVMELVNGQTLYDLILEKRWFSPKQAVQITHQIAQALEIVHQGIVVDNKLIQFIHRDLKPANIFIMEAGTSHQRIKLADFGLVKSLGDASEQSLTQTGLYAGTPDYSSPEQINQFKQVDARSDLYSLGCLFYRLLAGTNLFHFGSETSYIEWLKAHLETTPQPLPARLQVPSEIEQVVMRCLAKDPDHRFQSATELIRALAAIESTLPDSTPPDSASKSARTHLMQLLQDHFKQAATIRFQQQESTLTVLLDRTQSSLNYDSLAETLTDVVQDLLPELKQAGLDQITVYSRLAGDKQPDWSLCFNTSDLVSTSAEIPSAEISGLDSKPPGPETFMGPDLSSYCFVRNLVMLTTSLPDPSVAVAELVRFIHELSISDKQVVLSLLEKRFKDRRASTQQEVAEALATMSISMQEWFRSLEALNEREQKSVAIWLSRYCADPEKVLPRLTASMVAAEEAEKVTQMPTPPQQYPAERVVFHGYPHWILLAQPLGAISLEGITALILLRALTVETITTFFGLFSNPLALLIALVAAGALARALTTLLKLIDLNQVVRKRPFSIGGIIGMGLLALLQPLQVPSSLIIVLMILVVLTSGGLHYWLMVKRFRQPILAMTDRGRIVITDRVVSARDLRDPQIDSFFPFQIQDLDIEQSWLGRQLGFGDLYLILKSYPKITLKFLAQPHSIKQRYEHQLDRLQQLATNIQVGQTLQPRDPWLTREIGEGGRYRIERFLGQGGMGTVYRGFDQQLNLPVAIKFMRGALSRTDSLERFQVEMRASIYLNDPRIVQVLNTGMVVDADSGTNSIPFLVMEYVSSPTLAQAIEDQPKWSSQRVINVAYEIAQALHCLHDGVVVNDQHIGIIHRDLKPANIFLVRGVAGVETIKLADFGLVKMQGIQQQSPQETGRILGTARYVSPEQCRGLDTLDGRTDIYSLGCILYELLSGTNPFGLPKKASTTQYLMAQVQQAPLPFPDYLNLSPDLSSLIFRCLEKDPDQRWPSAAALSLALEDLRDPEGL